MTIDSIDLCYHAGFLNPVEPRHAALSDDGENHRSAAAGNRPPRSPRSVVSQAGSVLTAHAMDGDERQARVAGCDDYDTKPVELPRLLGKIEALLNT